MKQMLSGFLQKQTPWWLKVAGSFENDPTFEEAVRFGEEWRKSAEFVATCAIARKHLRDKMLGR
ncbi:hypothetical protein [Nostoc sp.]|uniref:hypothetical protein n=1 Tax=Nostoc sp. TaxID=1180 RepID=UPI002FF4B9D1